VPETRIGISGWSYAGWRGDFYPAGMSTKAELRYASRKFNSIEINSSFYSLQRPEVYRRWHAETPPGFRFAVKGSRFITHNKKLGDVETPLANFFASGLLCLDEKLGPILWQLSPNLKLDEDRVERFFSLLPRTTEEAAKLGRRHDQRVAGRSWTEAPRTAQSATRSSLATSPSSISVLRASAVGTVSQSSSPTARAGHTPRR
jgi:uncharacterized protein YecE (DUF72 family)